MDDGWDELKAVKMLDITRKSQENNKGLSFATIAGYGPHGALPHYQPTNATNTLILKDSTFVLDSGGQYDGNLIHIIGVTNTKLPNGKWQRKIISISLFEPCWQAYSRYWHVT